jgi:hypothetical protein
MGDFCGKIVPIVIIASTGAPKKSYRNGGEENMILDWIVQHLLVVRIVAGGIAFICIGLFVYWGRHEPIRTSEDEPHP